MDNLKKKSLKQIVRLSNEISNSNDREYIQSFYNGINTILNYPSYYFDIGERYNNVVDSTDIFNQLTSSIKTNDPIGIYLTDDTHIDLLLLIAVRDMNDTHLTQKILEQYNTISKEDIIKYLNWKIKSKNDKMTAVLISALMKYEISDNAIDRLFDNLIKNKMIHSLDILKSYFPEIKQNIYCDNGVCYYYSHGRKISYDDPNYV